MTANTTTIGQWKKWQGAIPEDLLYDGELYDIRQPTGTFIIMIVRIIYYRKTTRNPTLWKWTIYEELFPKTSKD